MEAVKKRIWVRGQYVEVTDEVYMAYTQGDRKMRYFENDLKTCQRRMVKNLKRRPENDPNAGNIALVIYAGTLSAGQLSAGSSAGGTGWTPAFHRSLSR